jgi:hypothetical protein
MLVEGDWEELVRICRVGDIQTLVVATIGDCPSVGALLDLLREVPLFLVSLQEEIATMPVTQVQSGQERVVAAFVKLGGTDKLRSEVLYEGPPRVEPLTFPPMKAKDIKVVTAIVKAMVGDPIQDEALDAAILEVAISLKITEDQAKDWVKTVLEGGSK